MLAVHAMRGASLTSDQPSSLAEAEPLRAEAATRWPASPRLTSARCRAGAVGGTHR